MTSHKHRWHPISRAEGSEPIFAFKSKAEPWRPAKPRGYEQPAHGDTVLWACDHSWTDYDKKSRQHKKHYCTATLTHPEMWRLKNKDEFTEVGVNVTPETAQTSPQTAAEKLAAARAMRRTQQ